MPIFFPPTLSSSPYPNRTAGKRSVKTFPAKQPSGDIYSPHRPSISNANFARDSFQLHFGGTATLAPSKSSGTPEPPSAQELFQLGMENYCERFMTSFFASEITAAMLAESVSEHNRKAERADKTQSKLDVWYLSYPILDDDKIVLSFETNDKDLPVTVTPKGKVSALNDTQTALEAELHQRLTRTLKEKETDPQWKRKILNDWVEKLPDKDFDDWAAKHMNSAFNVLSAQSTRLKGIVKHAASAPQTAEEYQDLMVENRFSKEHRLSSPPPEAFDNSPTSLMKWLDHRYAWWAESRVSDYAEANGIPLQDRQDELQEYFASKKQKDLQEEGRGYVNDWLKKEKNRGYRDVFNRLNAMFPDGEVPEVNTYYHQNTARCCKRQCGPCLFVQKTMFSILNPLGLLSSAKN